jgi:hypothetical protein
VKTGSFFLSRVVKLGLLDQSGLQNAILRAPRLDIRKYSWTITNAFVDDSQGFRFIYGLLAKYDHEGCVTTVDEESNSTLEIPEKNLLAASSPFVYLPEFSGIAYQHIWNKIEEETFRDRFQKLIEEHHNGFFVGCELEPVADYEIFGSKVRQLDIVTEISAKVHPPNPLYGRLWAPLNEYLSRRNAAEVNIKEGGRIDSGLQTQLGELIRGTNEDENYTPETNPEIADSAVLMAADGYGKGKVIGKKGSQSVVVKTSDSQKSFRYGLPPDPTEFAIEARKYFQRINEERHMVH